MYFCVWQPVLTHSVQACVNSSSWNWRERHFQPLTMGLTQTRVWTHHVKIEKPILYQLSFVDRKSPLLIKSLTIFLWLLSVFKHPISLHRLKCCLTKLPSYLIWRIFSFQQLVNDTFLLATWQDMITISMSLMFSYYYNCNVLSHADIAI